MTPTTKQSMNDSAPDWVARVAYELGGAALCSYNTVYVPNAGTWSVCIPKPAPLVTGLAPVVSREDCCEMHDVVMDRYAYESPHGYGGGLLGVCHENRTIYYHSLWVSRVGVTA